MSRRIFKISHFAWLLTVSLTTFVDGEDASKSDPFGPAGTGVGTVNRSINVQIGMQDPPPRPIRDTLRSKPLSTDYIEKALNAPLKSPLQFENQPFRGVVAHIAEEYSLPVLIDERKFEEIAISPDTEVTINLKDVSLRSALNIILQQPGLEDTSFAVLNEVLTFTTEERCAESQFVRVYPTEDFVYSNGHPQGGGAISWAEYSPLVAVITDCVAPLTWEENGSGDGQIQIIKPGILIVRQEYRVHVEIVKLLNDLRTELRIMEKELGRETLKETGRFYDRGYTPPLNRRGGAWVVVLAAFNWNEKIVWNFCLRTCYSECGGQPQLWSVRITKIARYFLPRRVLKTMCLISSSWSSFSGESGFRLADSANSARTWSNRSAQVVAPWGERSPMY